MTPFHAFNKLKSFKKLTEKEIFSLEKLISESYFFSFYYATEVLKGRFLLGESVIAMSPSYSYHYAKDVLKGRFGPGEKAISKCSMNSLRYAKDVLKGRFYLGEKAIFEDEVSAEKEEYEKDILKKKI